MRQHHSMPEESKRDLEERLRTWVNNPLCIEAADEIKRLREMTLADLVEAKRLLDENKQLRLDIVSLCEQIAQWRLGARA